MLFPADIAERFARNFAKGADCWLWSGTLDRDGYGRFGLNNRQPAAHRISWQLHKGEIPAGLNVCHHCDTPACVNPDHLFLGTQKDNLSDCARKGRTALGEKQGRSKLRVPDVLEIRRMGAVGIPQRTIASQFNVSQSSVSDIVSRRKWPHV